MRLLKCLVFLHLTVIHIRTDTDDIPIGDNLCDDFLQSTQQVYFLVGQLVVLSQTNDFELLHTGSERLRYNNFRMTTVQLSKETFTAFEHLDESIKHISASKSISETSSSLLSIQNGFQRLSALIREILQAVDGIYYDEFESLLNQTFQTVVKANYVVAHISGIANRFVDSNNDIHALTNSYLEFITKYPTKRFFDTWSISQKSRSELENDNLEAMVDISSICSNGVTDSGANGIEITTAIVDTSADDIDETVEIIGNGVIAILLTEEVTSQHSNISKSGNISYLYNSGYPNRLLRFRLLYDLQLLLYGVFLALS